MRLANLYLVLLTSILGAGCAGRANLTEAVAAVPTPAATAVSDAAASPIPVGGELATTVVDGNELAARSLPICRDVLRPGSNVIVTQCLSAEGWKAWQRREERAAQEVVRQLQGGRYR